MIRLTPDNHGKTMRPQDQDCDHDTGYRKWFAYITVEFLTKTPSLQPQNTRRIYYQIKVEDSKGDTDIASKTFSVQPDLPPNSAISIDTAFEK